MSSNLQGAVPTTKVCPSSPQVGGAKRSRSGALLLAVALIGRVELAQAHLDLTTPVPREQGRFRVGEDPNSNLKQGPCGQVEPGRTDRVNVYAPGETITVTWEEYVDHPGYFRVAFDPDGDDGFPVFDGPGVVAEGDDPAGNCPVDGAVILAYELDDRRGGTYSLDVQLPDLECDQCTLQVVQYMYGRSRPYYFQCADLVLRRPPSDAGRAVEADAGRFSAEAAPGCSRRLAPPDPTDNADSAGAPADAGPVPETPEDPAASGANPSTVAANAQDPDSTPGRSGGCAAAGGGASPRPWWLLLFGLQGLFVWRRQCAGRRRRG